MLDETIKWAGFVSAIVQIVAFILMFFFGISKHHQIRQFFSRLRLGQRINIISQNRAVEIGTAPS
jgi:hypothetical protein